MLFGGMCGQYERLDEESKKGGVNVGHAEWS